MPSIRIVAVAASPNGTIYDICVVGGVLYALDLTGRLFSLAGSVLTEVAAPFDVMGFKIIPHAGTVIGSSVSAFNCVYQWNGVNAWTKMVAGFSFLPVDIVSSGGVLYCLHSGGVGIISGGGLTAYCNMAGGVSAGSSVLVDFGGVPHLITPTGALYKCSLGSMTLAAPACQASVGGGFYGPRVVELAGLLYYANSSADGNPRLFSTDGLGAWTAVIPNALPMGFACFMLYNAQYYLGGTGGSYLWSGATASLEGAFKPVRAVVLGGVTYVTISGSASVYSVQPALAGAPGGAMVPITVPGL